MDNQKMIQKLQNAGIEFAPGMTEAELDRAEATFGFRFPLEIRAFLSCGVPVGKDFFDYRDLSEKNIEKFHNFQNWIRRHFRFDLENNRQEMLELLGNALGFQEDSPGFDAAVMEYWRSSVKLIPFYAHRCFFDGMDHMPILSFWQPTDVIYYGGSFENYLAVEFLDGDRILENIPERMAHTGIWRDLIW